MDMNRFETYLARADAEYQAGFKSKAARDRACSNVNFALEMCVEEITTHILKFPLEIRTQESMDSLYWDLCGVRCHDFTKKASKVISVLGEAAAEWVSLSEQCVALYTTYKSAQINAVPPSPVKEIEMKVQKTIMQMLAERNEKYNRCMRLERLFGTMGVSVNVHIVQGHKGTVFPRCFYYVMGVLTPLNTIIAAMQEADHQKLLG